MKAVNLLAPEHEHEFEAAHGLPEALPEGEQLLWQGSPQAWPLARQAMHLDLLALYFAGLMVWRGLGAWQDGATLGGAVWSAAGTLPLSLLALGLLGTLAWLIARTTVYTLTNVRLVMRIGVVLSITFNLPHRRIASVALRRRGADCGDLALTLSGEDRIAYAHLWPHARPWCLKQPQPMLRALAQPEEVGRLFAQALREAQADASTQGVPMRPVRTVPLPERRPATTDGRHATAL